MGVGAATLAKETRRCSTCDREKPIAAFGVKERNADGTIRRRHASCQTCRGQRVRARLVVMLPITPLQRWLSLRLADEGVWDPRTGQAIPDHRAPRSLDQIARDWGVSAKRMQDILKGRLNTISDVYADRLLTGAGSPHLLVVLYQDALEVFDEESVEGFTT